MAFDYAGLSMTMVLWFSA